MTDCYVPPGARRQAPKRFVVASKANSEQTATPNAPIASYVPLTEVGNAWYHVDTPADMTLYQLSAIGPPTGGFYSEGYIWINNNGPIVLPLDVFYTLEKEEWPPLVGRLVFWLIGLEQFTIVFGDP